jgi:hypothetical protein
MERVFQRLEGARSQITNMVAEGMVSPYETYGLLERIEILAKVAPESGEFRYLVSEAEEKGGFGGMEQRRYEIALKNAKSLKDTYNIYPYRNVKTETRSLVVEGFTDKGEVITKGGTFKLAGVKFDHQAFGLKDPETVFAEQGIHVGKRVPVTLIEGQFDSELPFNTTLEAIIGSANKHLKNSLYASEDYTARSPLASQVLSRTGIFSSLSEKLLHGDNMISNKFLRVRSGLEQFKRGEVYGTDDFSLKHIGDNYIIPTVNSLISKNPVAAGVQGAVIAGMFFNSAEGRGKAAMIGGAVAASLSLLRGARELITGEDWTPRRYRRSSEFEEYYDMLAYVKEATIAKRAEEKDLREQRNVSNDAKHVATQQGTYKAIADDADRRAKRTMYGFDVAYGTLEEALASIPRRHRPIAESIITTASRKEKAKFYDLLPDNEKRVLGKFLDVDIDDLPENPTVAEYFKQHYLPEANWAGWRRDTDLQDIKIRATELEGIKISRPSRKRLDRARAFTRDTDVPRMDKPTYRNVRREIDKLAANGDLGKIVVDYASFPSTSSVINFNLDVLHDRTKEGDYESNKEIRRA